MQRILRGEMTAGEVMAALKWCRIPKSIVSTLLLSRIRWIGEAIKQGSRADRN